MGSVNAVMVTNQPACVSTHDGIVVETKPDGTPVEMTPEAAVKTAAALIEAAARAEGEARFDEEQRARRADG